MSEFVTVHTGSTESHVELNSACAVGCHPRVCGYYFNPTLDLDYLPNGSSPCVRHASQSVPLRSAPDSVMRAWLLTDMAPDKSAPDTRLAPDRLPFSGFRALKLSLNCKFQMSPFCNFQLFYCCSMKVRFMRVCGEHAPDKSVAPDSLAPDKSAPDKAPRLLIQTRLDN